MRKEPDGHTDDFDDPLNTSDKVLQKAIDEGQLLTMVIQQGNGAAGGNRNFFWKTNRR